MMDEPEGEGNASVISISSDEEERVGLQQVEAEENFNEDQDWEDEEILRRVIEISKIEYRADPAVHEGQGQESLSEESESEDLKKAIELSLQCEPSDQLSERDQIPTEETQKRISLVKKDTQDVYYDLEEFELDAQPNNNISVSSVNQRENNEPLDEDFAGEALNEAEDQEVISSSVLEKKRISACDSRDGEEGSSFVDTTQQHLELDFEETVISRQELSQRMKNVFQSSLNIGIAERDPCDAIVTELYPHQKAALAWMSMHENTDHEGMFGGILADDMGLGKTLSIISLILTNHWDDGLPLAFPHPNFLRPQFSCYGKEKENIQHTKRNLPKSNSSSSNDDDRLSSSKTEPQHKRWRKKMRKKGFVTNVSISSSEDDEFDLMSKSATLSEKLHSSLVSDDTDKKHCKDDHPLDSPPIPNEGQDLRKMIFYSDSDDDGEPSSSTDRYQTPAASVNPKTERKCTLIVCPTSLISHWVEQFNVHIHKTVDIKIKVHHGRGKAITRLELESYDVVITTYGTLSSEADHELSSPLLRARWLRVVLDEGHSIKNHNSKCCKAALRLDTLRKWCVTGTPIQNNLMELWSLVNWLGFKVYSGKGQMQMFREQIELPCKRGQMRGFKRLQVLLETICLRRTKEDKTKAGEPLVKLPDKCVITRKVKFSGEERICYDNFHAQAKAIVKTFQRKGELLKNYAHVFALLIRLRQLCCHRQLVPKDLLSSDDSEQDEAHATRELVKNLVEMIASGVSFDCCYCFSDVKAPIMTPCAHLMCSECVEFLFLLNPSENPSCPLCQTALQRSKMEKIQINGKGANKGVDGSEEYKVTCFSSKVNCMMIEVLQILQNHPDDKIIIVSQFTSFLAIVEVLLRKENIPFLKFDGTMSHINRAETIVLFQSCKESSPPTLLMSLKAGGVGLNLTAANHLLLLDPAWNPASEWQCCDRIHRIGQTKPVFIYKFITENSVEEKMIEIQNKKRDLISGAFQFQPEDQRRKKVEEIVDIFGL